MESGKSGVIVRSVTVIGLIGTMLVSTSRISAGKVYNSISIVGNVRSTRGSVSDGDPSC